MPSNPQRHAVVEAITSEIAAAADRGALLRSRTVAEQLAAQYPQSGMTVEEIENEVLRQSGRAHVAAEFGASDE